MMRSRSLPLTSHHASLPRVPRSAPDLTALSLPGSSLSPPRPSEVDGSFASSAGSGTQNPDLCLCVDVVVDGVRYCSCPFVGEVKLTGLEWYAPHYRVREAYSQTLMYLEGGRQSCGTPAGIAMIDLSFTRFIVLELVSRITRYR